MAPRDGGRVSRSVRGRALATWHRGGALIAPLVVILLVVALPLPWYAAVLLATVVVVAVGWTIGDRVRGWYDRS